MEELLENNFIEKRGFKGEVFTVTNKGYEYADKLKEEVNLLQTSPATSTKLLLTNPGNINNKLLWWLGQQSDFVLNETKCKRPVVWRFSSIDERLNLTPGSSKKHLHTILTSDQSPFPAIVENVSTDTIRLKYDLSP